MSEPLYLTIARKDIGLKEIVGSKHHQKILEAFKLSGATWITDDETPWCAAFLASWLLAAKFSIPKSAYRALSWLTYGAGLYHPMQGAIAVKTRQGGGHVGIVTGVTADKKYVRVLGANQNNMVCEAFYAITQISNYRVPIGVTLTEPQICELGELSKTEQ